MKKFAIKIIDEKVRESYDMPCCIGEIQIDDYKETFEMPLEYWTMDDYKRQWKEGIERLKEYDRSCLVAELQDPEKAPRAILWVLYKEGDIVYIRNNLLYSKRFIKMLKKQPFTLETCYNFTHAREISDTDMPVSEWKIPLS